MTPLNQPPAQALYLAPKSTKPPLMEVIFLLILLSLIVAAGFLYAFFWAVKDGQFEDDYTPSVRILFDDGTKTVKEPKNDPPTPPKTETEKEINQLV